MADGFGADPEQLRRHAEYVDQLRERLAAVRTASAHIFQADGAYGLLCDWIPGVLEERHLCVDEQIDMLDGNLTSHVQALNACADAYEAADEDAASALSALETEL